jgi:ketosteroid isomerase-like protein
MTTPSLASAVAHEFWLLMATNDFDQVTRLLANEFVLDYPQSKERIRGPENFVQFNREYPAHGPWQFTVHRIVGNETEAVSDVTVSDTVTSARAISFFTVSNGKVTRIVEFWPEPYDAPSDRADLTEPLVDD